MTREEKMVQLIEIIKSMNDDELAEVKAALESGRSAKQYMSVNDMAELLGIGINQAYAMCHREDFYPAVKVSDRRYVISIKMLNQWMQDRGRNSKP